LVEGFDERSDSGIQAWRRRPIVKAAVLIFGHQPTCEEESDTPSNFRFGYLSRPQLVNNFFNLPVSSWVTGEKNQQFCCIKRGNSILDEETQLFWKIGIHHFLISPTDALPEQTTPFQINAPCIAGSTFCGGNRIPFLAEVKPRISNAAVIKAGQGFEKTESDAFKFSECDLAI